MISVLLIEDDAALIDLTRNYLERNKVVSADTAMSGVDALAKIDKRSYDAVVSDYLMPDMDGITLLKKLRSLGNRVPFIIFTGKSQEQVVIEALNNGADFFLQKGGDPKTRFAELENMIMQAISRRNAEEDSGNPSGGCTISSILFPTPHSPWTGGKSRCMEPCDGSDDRRTGEEDAWQGRPRIFSCILPGETPPPDRSGLRAEKKRSCSGAITR